MRNKILWILILAVARFGLAIQTGPNQIVHSQGRGGAVPYPTSALTLLFRQFGSEGFLSVGDIPRVTFRIDESC